MSEVKTFSNYSKGDPKFYLSKNKIPGSPVIVFVHFYGGHQRILKRHIDLVNKLGFDAFAFNMPEFAGLKLSLLYKGRFGLKHLYARMLNYYLDQIQPEKVIFAFSNPSAAAIECITDRTREGKNDVLGLICDSGPSYAFIRSAWNLSLNTPRSFGLLALFSCMWSLRLHHEIRNQLRHFPLKFPILSIRGGQDSVIPVWHIDSAFRGLDEYINLEVATFSEAGHLDALKKFPEKYQSLLELWLQKRITIRS
jgi:pimeloyl-ACP methyl ester carboxylesterase